MTSTHEEYLRLIEDGTFGKIAWGQARYLIDRKDLTPEFCLEVVKQDGYTLQHIPEEMITFEICLAAVRKTPGSVSCIPIAFRCLELYQEAFKNSKSLGILCFIPKEFRNSEEDRLLTEQEILERHTCEELLTSKYPYFRELGRKGTKNET